MPADAPSKDIRLTQLAQCGGCAAKFSPVRLEALLAGLPPAVHPDLLVGLDPADDCAVFRLDDERALVATLDFFPPMVDDPADFGSIAATNALNDVFAMGATPLLALSIAAFPEDLDGAALTAIVSAAADQARAAGAVLAGGHTIRDAEPKFGLAVVGTVHPEEIWRKDGARPGDVLYLTKPLGTGLLAQAARKGLEVPMGEAIRWMTTLNRDAARALRALPHGPHAVTDVTGFGLIGHAIEMAERSGVRLELEGAALPAMTGALELAASGPRTGGEAANRNFAAGRAEVAPGAGAAIEALAFDPQTAGGLLVSMAADAAAALERRFSQLALFHARIGVVRAGRGVVLG